MPADGIFRIASQTKAVTSVAVMILPQEEGKILLGRSHRQIHSRVCQRPALPSPPRTKKI